MPPIKYRGDASPVSFVRCQLDVTTAGKVKLLFQLTAALTAWLDGNPVELSEPTILDLAAGVIALWLPRHEEPKLIPAGVGVGDEG